MIITLHLNCIAGDHCNVLFPLQGKPGHFTHHHMNQGTLL